MEIRNGFSFRTSVRAWGYLVALGCLSLSAHAQSDFGEKIWWKADAGSWVPDYNKSAAFPAKATPLGGALVVNGAGIVHGPAEWPKASARAPIPGLSKSAAIDVVARFKPASVGAAFGRLASKVGPLGSAVALVTFAAEIGVILTEDPAGGPPQIGETDPSICTTAPCTRFRPDSIASWAPIVNTLEGACRLYISGLDASSRDRFYESSTQAGGATYGHVCRMRSVYRATGAVSYTDYPFTQSETPARPASVNPITATQLADKIASTSGWPTSSTIGPAIAEALRRGEVIETEAPAVSGPASSPVSNSTTTKPDGSVTTTTTTNNYTYNTNKVTVTTTTVATTVNPSTGTTETTTTTENEAPPETPPEEEKGACDLYPDALGCAELDEPTEEIPRDEETIDYQEENVFGSGSCPANLTASIATLGQSVTVWDWSKTCELALPLRALVLGLATFAALLIVMPGDNKT